MTWVAWRHEERRTAATGRFLRSARSSQAGTMVGPKDKKSKGRRKTSPPGGKASRAASLREVERFRQVPIRAAEQRRAARQDSPTEAPPADTEQHTPAEEHLAASDAALQVHLAACIQAAQNQDWGLLKDTARQLAEAAANPTP